VKLIRLDDSDAIAAITNLDDHAAENGQPSNEPASTEEQHPDSTDATNQEGLESSGDQ